MDRKLTNQLELKSALGASLLLLFAAAGCIGTIGGSSPDNPTPMSENGGTGGTAGSGGTGGPAPQVWMPARVRRLSNRELDNSVQDLLGTAPRPLSPQLASDARQGGFIAISGFTQNVNLRVDPTIVGQLWSAVDGLAQQAVAMDKLRMLVGTCNQDATCAGTFIDTFGRRAFRRPVTPEERTGLLELYNLAATGGTFAEGIKAVVSAMMQSASFLYVTELGTGTGNLRDLTAYETASALSYLTAATLPDATLLDAAGKDALRTPDQRAMQVQRLQSNPHAGQQTARVFKEWLNLDQVATLDRATPPTVKTPFATLKTAFDGETDAFIKEVMTNGDGTLGTVLTADFTMANGVLAGFYGVTGAAGTNYTRVSLDTPTSMMRRGLLSQANFLTSNISTDSPIGRITRRGKAVLNQLLCQDLELPTDPNVLAEVMNPPDPGPDPTTREAAVAMTSGGACIGCHSVLNPLGYAFENFDDVGNFRTTDKGKAIDASGQLAGMPFGNSADFVRLLASSEEVRECFAKNFFRFASGQPSGDGTDAQFLDVWRSLPAAARTQLAQMILGYVRSDMFITRRAP